MSKYFTPMLRAGNGNNKEYYIEEFEAINPLSWAHKKFGLVFNTFKEAKDKAHEIMEKNGGSFIGHLPMVGQGRVKRKLSRSGSLY